MIDLFISKFCLDRGSLWQGNLPLPTLPQGQDESKELFLLSSALLK